MCPLTYLCSRARRVKCDSVRPVCGRCMKGHRQCIGFGASNRLIMKDETQDVVKRFGKKPADRSSPESPLLSASTSSAPSPSSTPDDSHFASRGSISGDSSFSNDVPAQKYQEFNDLQEFDNQEIIPIPQNPMMPVYEQNQVALHCCRETVNLRTLSWIMSDEKWVDLLPEMMSRSNALCSVIYANAATYLARRSGANSTPKIAINHYITALRELQLDLYDPVRQASDETLFSIILLGVFDVCLHNPSI
jgi:Fungal specific transcription factor domain